jgi:hypothetical protein
VQGYLLRENVEMRALLEKFQFQIAETDDPAVLTGRLVL